MSLAYGYDIKDGDKMLQAPIQTIELLAPLVLPGGALVNHLPFSAPCYFTSCHLSNSSPPFIVRHIPSWVPYLSYKPLARIVRKLSKRMRDEPIEFVKNALVCGSHYFHLPVLCTIG
jgi:hypothetical protein